MGLCRARRPGRRAPLPHFTEGRRFVERGDEASRGGAGEPDRRAPRSFQILSFDRAGPIRLVVAPAATTVIEEPEEIDAEAEAEFIEASVPESTDDSDDDSDDDFAVEESDEDDDAEP